MQSNQLNEIQLRDTAFAARIGLGYRVYLGRHGATLVILLCGGDKRTQDADIKRFIFSMALRHPMRQ
jgi:putative addiction module killer protein